MKTVWDQESTLGVMEDDEFPILTRNVLFPKRNKTLGQAFGCLHWTAQWWLAMLYHMKVWLCSGVEWRAVMQSLGVIGVERQVS